MAELAVTGVDACARGWVAVTLGPGSFGSGPLGLGTDVRIAVAATLDGLSLTGVTGIDMPLGLLAAGWRDADVLARRALGRRGVTVFAIPPRPVWECESYAEASRRCRELTGKSFSVQAWGLRRKIAEADEFRRRLVAPGQHSVHLYEVHPELAFAAMAGAVLAVEAPSATVPTVDSLSGTAQVGETLAGAPFAGPPLAGAPFAGLPLAGAPLADSKHTKAGLAARRDLLARAGIDVPPRVPGAAADDLLDAAAVAWSARRIAAGHAIVLANQAQRADDGMEIAIRY